MVTKKMIDDFLSCKKLAIVGVSRSGSKFGNSIYKELTAKGYKLYPVNAYADKINNVVCYPDLKSIPEKIDGIITVVLPAETEKVVQQAISLGIKQIWMQQGSESDSAVQYCEENNVNVIFRECILMFAEPLSIGHKIHRWIWGIIGKLPR